MDNEKMTIVMPHFIERRLAVEITVLIWVFLYIRTHQMHFKHDRNASVGMEVC